LIDLLAFNLYFVYILPPQQLTIIAAAWVLAIRSDLIWAGTYFCFFSNILPRVGVF